MLDFYVRGSCSGREREDDLGDQLSLVDRCRERPEEELRGFDRPLADSRAHDELRTECEHDRGQVGRGIGVGEAPTDRAAVADLEVADLGGALGDCGER
jgi:hypothetical protein